MGKYGKSLKISLPSLAPLPGIPRNPPGWNASELSIRKRSFPFAETFQEPRITEIPPDFKERFPGMTLPEYAVWIGLVRNNRQPDLDFVYRHVLMGLGVSYYSTVDYMLPREDLALEVQGEYWHYLDSDREARDVERWFQLAQDGILLIFIDETDALTRPEWVVKEALSYQDHSALASRRNLG